MSQPVYKVWFMKYKEPWYKLTPDERNAFMAKNIESQKKLGIETVKMCVSVWASEEWLAWGVEKASSIEAFQQHSQNLFDMNWFEYIESKTYLGVEMPQG